MRWLRPADGMMAKLSTFDGNRLWSSGDNATTISMRDEFSADTDSDLRHCLGADIDPHLGHDLDSLRMNPPGLGAGAQYFKPHRGQGSPKTFSHLASAGVSRAKKENGLGFDTLHWILQGTAQGRFSKG